MRLVVIGQFPGVDLDSRTEWFRFSKQLVELEWRRFVLGTLPVPSVQKSLNFIIMMHKMTFFFKKIEAKRSVFTLPVKYYFCQASVKDLHYQD